MKINNEAWLICPNWTEVRRFIKSKNNNKYNLSEYIFIDSGFVVGTLGEKTPLMKTRKEIKIEDALIEYQYLITSGWQVIEPKW